VFNPGYIKALSIAAQFPMFSGILYIACNSNATPFRRLWVSGWCHCTHSCRSTSIPFGNSISITNVLLTLLSTVKAFIADLRKGHAGIFKLYDQHGGDDHRCAFLLVQGCLADTANNVNPAAFTVAHFDPIGSYIFVGTSNDDPQDHNWVDPGLAHKVLSKWGNYPT
jgi:hypothetical protein